MGSGPVMRSALLHGPDHGRIGAVAAVAEGRAAITLCRGGAAKTYSHTDPNEDAVLFALGPGGALVAVADGHHGASGSAAVLEYLEREIAEAWTAESCDAITIDTWSELALDIFAACNHAVLERAGREGLSPAPTTLSWALYRQREGLLAHASIGDSHVFRCGPERVEDLGWATLGRRRAYYLGYEAGNRESRGDYCVVGCEAAADTRAVVLATDGLSETGIGVSDPAAAVADALAQSIPIPSERRPLEACKHLTQTALTAHRTQAAGDNIACAVLLLEG